jgi:hypothetical protein
MKSKYTKPNTKDMLSIEPSPCPHCKRVTKSIWKDGKLFCLSCEGIKK